MHNLYIKEYVESDLKTEFSTVTTEIFIMNPVVHTLELVTTTFAEFVMSNAMSSAFIRFSLMTHFLSLIVRQSE